MDKDLARRRIDGAWEDSVVPTLCEYVRIPNQSPFFEPGWEAAGHMEKVVRLVSDWISSRKLRNATFEVLRSPGRTPLLFLEVPADRAAGSVLLYGHLDKQPPFEGWREGLGPWTPVIEGNRLYGRGSADDGYAAFSIVTAIEALQEQNLPHPRLVGMIECSEESGSVDLPAYMDEHAARIGTPDLVICLDSGCGDYDRLWTTTSLRGLVAGNLEVGVLSEGVHSGDASGVVASSFRILRLLLDRLEDSKTGRMTDGLHVEIPELRLRQARATAEIVGPTIHEKLPLLPGVRPTGDDLTELLLARTWRPAMSVTGVAGMPTLEQAGNVLRPNTAVKLSIRIPPTLDAQKATQLVRETLEKDPPYGARVRFDAEKSSAGWQAPPPTPWLSEALADGSRAYFGKEPADLGEGGSIPFMAMLGERFPKAQFLITGVLGPQSNAHGPNEFLDLPTARRVTACVAGVLAASAGKL